MTQNHFDVLILGAGLSGIGAACHLTRRLPGKRYAVLERREAIGGTWDLFRYPGIRSDSDMSTFGYSFRPWAEPKVLADGPSIKRYVSEAAEEYGVIPHIRFGRKVVRAEWSSPKSAWVVTTVHEKTGEQEQFSAQFLIAATGYYRYDQGYAPEFFGQERFQGQIVHPQHWPEDLQYQGKRVVVIGSGATAITLVPSMAQRGAQVTMLQRSPTYVLSVPAIDRLWGKLSAVLPRAAVYRLIRIKNVLQQRLLFVLSRKRPGLVKKWVRKMTRSELQDKVDVQHFTPRYNPWDERLCVVPDGDLFKALRNGSASIVTDTIQHFDETGIQLASGRHLPADIIVTATGLNLQLMGGAQLVVDGQVVPIRERLAYKGMMFEGVPNMLAIFGYTNASWTLKADIVCEHFMRMIGYMERKRLKVVTPRAQGVRRTEETVMGSLSSGYVRRGADHLPRQGDRAPWAVLNDYLRDAIALKLGSVRHPALEYRGR